MKSLCVEGWRFINHSYAMVNQWQLLSLLTRKDISLSVRDVAFFRSDWRCQKDLFDRESENRLASIPTLAADEYSDATFRIAFPYNLRPLPKGRTVVFGTSEFQVVDETMLAAPIDVRSLSSSDSFSVVTPSCWSREGFLRLGLREDQVAVVPHGVAKDIFYPSSLKRKKVREKLKLSGFTFANASAMTGNKGIDLLLQAFSVVLEKRPHVRLLLKGSDDLYGSINLLKQTISTLPSHIKDLVAKRITYLGGAISVDDMAKFYRAADAYVSPYRAEGFNLPPLEALACGTPVICTKGGSTDEFLDDRFALFIDSQKKSVNVKSISGVTLEPSLDHLIQLMFRVMDDESWRRKASVAGANHAATHFNWDTIVDQLVVAIFKDSS